MKKYFVITLLTTLLLTSCFKKEEEKETSTSSVSTGNVTAEEKIEVLNSGETEEASTSITDENEEKEVKFGEIIEEGENFIYRDSYKGYEVKLKKFDGFDYHSGEKIFPGLDFMVYSKKTGNTIGFVGSPIPEEYSDFESFSVKFFEDIKQEKGIESLKKDAVEISGVKGYKTFYDLNGKNTEQYLLSEGKKVFLITLVISDKKTEKQFNEVLKGFSLIK